MFRGSFTALVTPFAADGSLDLAALSVLVERQMAGGSDGLVLCGTTGESPTLSAEEQSQVLSRCREIVGDTLPLIMGCGTNSTRGSVERCRAARAGGADAALVVMPYYNKPNPAGLLEHFRQVGAEGGLPVVAYNVPGRTGSAPSAALLRSICDLPQVVGLKEASGDLGLACDLLGDLPAGVALLSGDDPTVFPFLAAGGHGVISVTSNVCPEPMAELCRAAREGRSEVARALHLRLMPLHRALFLEPNPIPVKEALAQLGLCRPEPRLPLARLAEALRPQLSAVLRRLELLA